MEILGISLVTNLAAGISGEPLNHEEVLEAGKAAATRMGDLLGQVVAQDLMRVLVTGAAGSIGRVVTRRAWPTVGHEVVGLDLVPEPEGFDGPWHTVDCADPDAVAAVFAAQPPRRRRPPGRHPDEARLPEALTSHVVTTAALLDAMVEHDVTRIVYASSNHAVGPHPARATWSSDRRPAPARHLLRRRQGRGRGAAQPVRRPLRHRRRRLPDRLLPRPARRACASCPPGSPTTTACGWSTAALTATAPGFAVLYGISRQHPRLVGPRARSAAGLRAAGRRRGVRRLDRARARRRRDEAAHVGGPFALAAFHRPALDRRRLDLECTPRLTLADDEPDASPRPPSRPA